MREALRFMYTQGLQETDADMNATKKLSHSLKKQMKKVKNELFEIQKSKLVNLQERKRL